MSALICGSLAYDTIMVFPDQFKEHILPDKVHILNVAFLVPEMRRNFGGCAGNIAFNLHLLGDLHQRTLHDPAYAQLPPDFGQRYAGVPEAHRRRPRDDGPVQRHRQARNEQFSQPVCDVFIHALGEVLEWEHERSLDGVNGLHRLDGLQ